MTLLSQYISMCLTPSNPLDTKVWSLCHLACPRLAEGIINHVLIAISIHDIDANVSLTSEVFERINIYIQYSCQ